VALDAGAGGSAEADMELSAFVSEMRCPISQRLALIHAAAPRPGPDDSKDRFLAISLQRRPSHYVQCIFFDGDRQMYCEAASGVFAKGSSQEVFFPLPAASLQALRDLRFSGDGSHANFQIEFPIDAATGLVAVADRMSRALYLGFGARADDAFRFDAPLAGGEIATCTPTG
jgi:hypothetical protein